MAASILTIAISVSAMAFVPTTETTPPPDAFNLEEDFAFGNFNSVGLAPDTRIGVHEVTVQAWEKKSGTCRCTILNSGIDLLDNVTCWVKYTNSTGEHLTTEKDMGMVGYIAVWEDLRLVHFHLLLATGESQKMAKQLRCQIKLANKA